MGGIIGAVWTGTANLENCVSAGKIVNTTELSGGSSIGSIAGGINVKEITITHCLWTSDVGWNNLIGYNHTIINISDSSFKDLNYETMDGLNEYVSNNNTWSKWFMIHINGGRINELTQEILIVTQKHFPNPVKDGYTFSFWCKDAKCTERYDPQTTNITGVTDLYAAWTINNYTITFVFNNGAENEVRVLNYNETIVYPENLTKEGHTFNGWSPKPVRMPAENIIVTAQWTEIKPSEPEKPSSSSSSSSSGPEKPLEFVEIVFERKDLKEEEIREIIQEYTKEKFIIERIETDNETGGTRVVIKFVDVEKAAEFVQEVNENKRPQHSLIKRADFASEYNISISPFIAPLIHAFYSFL